MILSANKRKTALVGGYYVQRKEDGSYLEQRGTIFYEQGVITKILPNVLTIAEAKKILPPDTFCIKLDDSFYIYPGLIDIHNHVDYNLMPIWERPIDKPWDNRHEWRHINCSEYQQIIKGLRGFLSDKDITRRYGISDIDIMLQYLAEIQALSGGTTVLQEPTELFDDQSLRSQHLLLRSTGVPDDLDLAPKQFIDSIIDFYRPNIAKNNQKYYPYQPTSTWNLCNYMASNGNVPLMEYINFLKQNSIQVIKKNTGGRIIHLAEGRAGNLLSGNDEKNGRGMDQYSKKEFENLKSLLKQIPDYAEKVAASRLSIIHGCGIDLKNKDNIKFINECKIRLVWSPVSNLLLYDDTPNFLDSGIDKSLLCLGSDWAPSGSKHIWDECLFARQFAHKYFKCRNDKDLNDRLFDMMTYNPAQALNPSRLGQIKEGYYADFYIVSKNKKLPDQVTLSDSNFDFSDKYTMGTIVNGNLVFGAEELFELFDKAYSIFIDRCSVKCSDGRNLKAYYPRKMLDYFNMRKKNFEVDIENFLERIDSIFREYCQGKPFSLSRTELLSSEDPLYLSQIAKLKKKFSL